MAFGFILLLKLIIPRAHVKTSDAPTAPFTILLSFSEGVEEPSCAQITGLKTLPNGRRVEPFENEIQIDEWPDPSLVTGLTLMATEGQKFRQSADSIKMDFVTIEQIYCNFYVTATTLHKYNQSRIKNILKVNVEVRHH